MLKPDRIDRYLPMTFPSGVKVSSFAKHCPHCKALVKAGAMHGAALMVVDRVFILAEARCPQCQGEFEVKCMFDDSKHVQPVLLASFLVRWLMQWHARKLVRHGIPLRPAAPVAAPHAVVVTPERTALLLADDGDVVKSDDILGRYLGQPIAAWIEYKGRRYAYSRAVPEQGQFRLAPHEVLFAQRLIYQRSDN